MQTFGGANKQGFPVFEGNDWVGPLLTCILLTRTPEVALKIPIEALLSNCAPDELQSL